MKKVLSILLTLCLFVNVSFAFDPYADEEIEKKSYKKLYYGIALTLIGGFLAYDGFSKEEVDVSKPSVDCTTVLHSEWNQNEGGLPVYTLSSGYSDYSYIPEGWTDPISIEQNVIYNNGNVDLKNITIEIRYKDMAKEIADYHEALIVDNQSIKTFDLAKGESKTWYDIWEYSTADPDNPSPPVGTQRDKDPAKDIGLYLGKDAYTLMDIRVVLKKNKQYKPIYETRHKSDLEGVAGIMVGLAGIYFLVDHFVDMHKFNNYAKRHHLNLKLATASNEYKLMLQKRI